MTDSAHYHDPRLVALYDLQNRWGADDDFFLGLANENPGSRVLDLGCGTGRLTVALAQAGHQVTGLDPARASLEVAQQKPKAEAVNWLHGTAADAPTAAFDLCLMIRIPSNSPISGTAPDMCPFPEIRIFSYSFQSDFIPQTGGFNRNQYDLACGAGLRGGCRLARHFAPHSPRPAAGRTAGLRHARPGPPRLGGVDSGDERDRFTLPDGSQTETWCKLLEVKNTLVTFAEYTRFLPAGEVLTSTSRLRFRSETELRESLAAAGFEIEKIYGGWHGEKVGEGCGELVVVARRE